MNATTSPVHHPADASPAKSGAVVNQLGAARLAAHALAVGRAIAFAGVLLPLVLIGALKFTPIEVDALKPIISNTPWLSFLYALFGEAGASYALGVAELTTAALLVASLWSPRAAIAGGILATGTFAVTVSTMLALPIWEAGSGGAPWLNALGSFLIKDVALLGVSLAVAAEGMQRYLGSRN